MILKAGGVWDVAWSCFAEGRSRNLLYWFSSFFDQAYFAWYILVRIFFVVQRLGSLLLIFKFTCVNSVKILLFRSWMQVLVHVGGANASMTFNHGERWLVVVHEHLLVKRFVINTQNALTRQAAQLCHDTWSPWTATSITHRAVRQVELILVYLLEMVRPNPLSLLWWGHSSALNYDWILHIAMLARWILKVYVLLLLVKESKIVALCNRTFRISFFSLNLLGIHPFLLKPLWCWFLFLFIYHLFIFLVNLL